MGGLFAGSLLDCMGFSCVAIGYLLSFIAGSVYCVLGSFFHGIIYGVMGAFYCYLFLLLHTENTDGGEVWHRKSV